MTLRTHKRQIREIGWKTFRRSGQLYRAKAEVRFDDQCRNGRNSFSITGEVQVYNSERARWEEHSAGCCHDEINAAHHSELGHLFRWHGCFTDGPSHYIANTLYHAGDRDHNGLRKGETRQICRGGDPNKPCWKLDTPEPWHKYASAVGECPPPLTLEYKPWLRHGEGKERDFDAARRTAVWPEATEEQLSLPPEELKVLLEARLPALLEEFRRDIEAFGFEWEAPEERN